MEIVAGIVLGLVTICFTGILVLLWLTERRWLGIDKPPPPAQPTQYLYYDNRAVYYVAIKPESKQVNGARQLRG